MRILYLGSSRGTSLCRFEALKSLGYEADLIDPSDAIPALRIARSWSARTGGLGLAAVVERFVLSRVVAPSFDLVFVDSGELISARLIAKLRRLAPLIVNYNPDNPYSDRDGRRWRLFKEALSSYDVLFVPRASNLDEAKALGARRVHRVWFTADDCLKDYSESGNVVVDEDRYDVGFVGTWMPERGGILLRLLNLGVDVRIAGPRWDRAPEYSLLRHNTRLASLSLHQYNLTVASARISIALLSKGNADLHTTRSIEIPMLGSVLCAERTSEHLALYEENVEAMFWSTPEECAQLCVDLLGDQRRLERMARAGRNRAVTNNLFNSQVMLEMVSSSLSINSENHRQPLGKIA
jgi:spore maturation protein CgeB